MATIPAGFTVETLPLSIMDTRGSFPAFTDQQCFHFRGTPSDFLNCVKRHTAQNPRLSREIADMGGDWTGENAPLKALEQGYSPDALAAFQASSAALSGPLQRGSPLLANQGPAFSIARVIQGHPIACFKRPRVKLPPRNLEFSVNCNGAVTPSDISNPVARIARAAWEYQAAGGPVTVTAHYLYSLKYANGPVTCAIISLALPLANLSQFATGASVQMYRAFAMPLRNVTLAGSYTPSAPLVRWNNPRIQVLTGNPDTDALALKALGVA